MNTLDKRQQNILLNVDVIRMMDIVRSEGELRVVGGAVRDIIMSRPVGDIDLATTLLPERMMEIFKAHGIKTVPTGLTHGTITAVINHIGYEITTLRRDLETDGRHAKVSFTDDWQADAARRDFTFNALFVDREGKVYDFFGGLKDSEAGYVRFIGNPRTRIEEDVLRILRFFRFYAWYGRTEIDKEGLEACRALAHLIPHLSAERMTKEVIKLLSAGNPLETWDLLIGHKIIQYFLPEATDSKNFKTLLDNENTFHEQQSSFVRLASLLPSNELIVAMVAKRLRLSNRESEMLYALATLPGKVHQQQSKPHFRRLLYKYGPSLCRAAVFLNGENIASLLELIDQWKNPVFSLKGQDLVKLGIAAGPQMGKILRATEEWWIETDFTAEPGACLDYARSYAKTIG